MVVSSHVLCDYSWVLGIITNLSIIISIIDHAAVQQFISPDHRDMLLVSEKPLSLPNKFEKYKPPETDNAKWALKMKNI